jgi:DNA-binding MarR family transcriptional regulator
MEGLENPSKKVAVRGGSMNEQSSKDSWPLPSGRAAALFTPKRFAIASLLYLRGYMTMARLKSLTGLSWGDLDSNIRFLSRKGLVVVKKVLTGEGFRTVVSLTSEGRRAYEELVDYLSSTLPPRRQGKLNTDARE